MVKIITFKVSDEFYEKYLKDKENKSEFIRYAIIKVHQLLELLGRDDAVFKDYELLIDVINDVARWRLKVYKPLEPEAKGRYLTYEIITDRKYKVTQRYIRIETLRKLYNLIHDVVEKLILNYHRDPQQRSV